MIKKVLHNGKAPVKIWTEDIEESAEKQLEDLQQMPFIFNRCLSSLDTLQLCRMCI